MNNILGITVYLFYSLSWSKYGLNVQTFFFLKTHLRFFKLLFNHMTRKLIFSYFTFYVYLPFNDNKQIFGFMNFFRQLENKLYKYLVLGFVILFSLNSVFLTCSQRCLGCPWKAVGLWLHMWWPVHWKCCDYFLAL